MVNKDLYEILGVSKTATQDEIKRAYRKLAHQYHPDKGGGNEEKFKEINAAYQVLGNEEKRKQYDQFGSAFSQNSGSGYRGFSWEDFARASGNNPFNGGFQQSNTEFDFGDLGDIFGDIFGFGSSGRKSRRRSKQSRGNDIQVEMEISFREAAFGADKFIELYKYNVCSRCQGAGAEPGSKFSTCPTCGGKGQIEHVQRTILGAMRSVSVCPDCRGEGKKAEKKCKACGGNGRIKESEKIKVKIPAGISDGETIRLAGKGEVGLGGSLAGDLFISIRVSPDPEFRREGDDVFSEVGITFSQAALGDKIIIKTLDGDVKLKIPAGTQSGKVFKLKEKGIPHLRSRGRGDHLVKVNVVTPKNLSREEKRLFKELAELEKR